MVIWVRDGRRYAQSAVGAMGVPEGAERLCGFVPLDATPPVHDPRFERAVDSGVDQDENGASVRWEIVARDLEEVKTERLAALADARWRAETGGVFVAENLLQTDRESRANLTGAALRADRALRAGDAYEVRWKTTDGWLTLDAAAVLDAAEAVERHVNACFAHESELAAALRAASDIDAIRMIDVDGGWPG